MADAETKQCTQCKQWLPRSIFYESPARKGGLYPWCPACSVRKGREYTDRDPGHKERKRAYDKARFERLGDKIRAQVKARYELKRESIARYSKDYAKANRQKIRDIGQAYKHRRRSVERTGMSGRELGVWKKAQAKVCHWCGIKCALGFVVDHVQPLAKGGKHEARNLAISCRPCNARKSARDPVDWARMIGKLI